MKNSSFITSAELSIPTSLPPRTTGRWWIGYCKKQSSTSLTGRSTSITTTASVMIRDTGSSGRIHCLRAKDSPGTSPRNVTGFRLPQRLRCVALSLS